MTRTSKSSMDALFDWLVGHMGEFRHFTYVVTYLILVLSGAGLPIPEEAVLLSSGYLAYEGITDIRITIPVVLLGMISGDLVTYFIGRHAGQGLFRHPLLRWAMTEDRLERIRRYYAKYGKKTVFFSRYVVGIRQASYFMAGAMRVPLKDFLMMEMLAACSTGPLSMYIAYRLGAHIDHVLEFFGRARIVLFAALVIGLLVFVVWHYRRARNGAKPVAIGGPPPKAEGEGRDPAAEKRG